jgi:DnaK suppressor protein
VMDKKQNKQLKAALEEQKVALMEELRQHGNAQEFGSTSSLKDSEERASTLSDLLVESRIVADDENLLEKIDLALKRIEGGDYGNCESCRERIPEARLLAKPSVSLCVPCQEKKDAGTLA